jgi:hypothetical protein
MSKGPGTIERRIADLLAGTRDHALDIETIARHAYELGAATPSRGQRLSATRAAHRVLRRVRDAYERSHGLRDEAREQTTAALGRKERHDGDLDHEYWDRLEADPAWLEAERLYEFADRIGLWMRFLRAGRDRLLGETDHWCATRINSRLRFHPPDVPMQVWAVRLDRNGVHWFDTEIIKVTTRNVMVRYGSESARLDRRHLWRWWAFWRGVRFVSSRTGRIAAELDKEWRERFAAGGTPPAMQMPLEQARALLGVPSNYTKADVISAFRQAVKKAHPDVGGTAEMFRVLVVARDRLLAAIGTSAPPPKSPAYAPSGVVIRYRSESSSSRRLSSGTRRLTST